MESLPLRRAARRLNLLSRAWHAFMAARGLRRDRARLLLLDDHLLRDIGLTPHDAAREASRPFWDAPDHWSSRPGWRP